MAVRGEGCQDEMVSWKPSEVQGFNKEEVASWANASDGTSRVRKYSLAT